MENLKDIEAKRSFLGGENPLLWSYDFKGKLRATILNWLVCCLIVVGAYFFGMGAVYLETSFFGATGLWVLVFVLVGNYEGMAVVLTSNEKFLVKFSVYKDYGIINTEELRNVKRNCLLIALLQLVLFLSFWFLTSQLLVQTSKDALKMQIEKVIQADYWLEVGPQGGTSDSIRFCVAYQTYIDTLCKELNKAPFPIKKLIIDLDLNDSIAIWDNYLAVTETIKEDDPVYLAMVETWRDENQSVKAVDLRLTQSEMQAGIIAFNQPNYATWTLIFCTICVGFWAALALGYAREEKSHESALTSDTFIKEKNLWNIRFALPFIYMWGHLLYWICYFIYCMLYTILSWIGYNLESFWIVYIIAKIWEGTVTWFTSLLGTSIEMISFYFHVFIVCSMGLTIFILIRSYLNYSDIGNNKKLQTWAKPGGRLDEGEHLVPNVIREKKEN